MKHLDHYAGAEPSKHISDTLVRRGGKNGMGFPIYRLVDSPAVMEKVGGIWQEWDPNLNVQDRGGIESSEGGAPVESHHRPERVAAELREVPTYSHLDEPGWVLERWYPASYFGSPTAWEQNVVLTPDDEGKLTVPSNIPRLGPFPSQGRYLMIVGPFPLEPDLGFLQDYIAWWEERRASFPTDVEEHIRNCVQRAMDREEVRSEHAMRENHMRLMDSVSPLTSTSLEAGRWRSKSFEKAGMTSHIGN